MWTARINASTNIFYDELSVNIMLVSIAIFVFAKMHINKPLKHEKAVSMLSFVSKCSFGIYLVHPLLIDILNRFAGINNLIINPVISVPVLAIFVFVCSLGISALINKLPVMKKWIV